MKFILALLLLFSFTAHSQSQNLKGYDDKGIWRELPISLEDLNEMLAQKTQKTFFTTNEIKNIQNACIREHVVNVLFKEIFNLRPKKYEQYSNRITAKRKDGKIFSRKQFSVSYVNSYIQPNEINVNVNDLKYFRSNPFISRYNTTLHLPFFPTVEIKRLEELMFDDLGNRRTHNREYAVIGIKNQDKTVGQIENKKTQETIGLEYDFKGLIECYQNAFDL